MELKNYKFITGQTIPRPWGIEFRFTATKGERIFDEIVMLSTGKEDEKEICEMIERHLDLVSAPITAATEPEHKEVTAVAVERYLKENLMIKETQSLVDVKRAMYDTKPIAAKIEEVEGVE